MIMLYLLTALVIAGFGVAQKTTSEHIMCKVPADIVFVIDSSSSIGLKNYGIELEFAADLTRKFAVGPDSIRFGAVVFGRFVVKLFDLKDFSDHQDLETALLSAQYMNSSTYTHEAFRFINDDGMFEAVAGGRDGVQDIVILVTDGISNIPYKTLKTAMALKAQNIKMTTVGIGSKVLDWELKAVASSPHYVFRTKDFQALNNITDLVALRECEASVVPLTTTTTPKPIGSQCIFVFGRECATLPNGDYPICHPECQQGIYVTCSNGSGYIRDCPRGWYKAEDGTPFMEKMVYDPEMYSCELESDFCPRFFTELARSRMV